MNRLAAWWSAWKWVVLLVLVCIGLAALNLYQFHRALSAPLRIENTALTGALKRFEVIATQRDRDDAGLLAELDAIAKRGQQVRTEYRTVIKGRPLPAQCAPGQERIDAVNRGLSGQHQEK